MVGTFLLAAFGVLFLLLHSRKTGEPAMTRLWMMEPPYSSDPIHYDAFVHHIAFTSVYSGLVTQYRKGEYLGVLAEKWEASKDHRVWSFQFRKGVTFETGEEIQPSHLIASWNRVMQIQKRRGSEAGFFDKLEPDGISHDDSSITLRFREPFPRLLDTIGFGLYSVIHPQCFDRDTGDWKCERSVISSGPYKVAKWDHSEVLLELRKEYPTSLRHPSAIQSVAIIWDKEQRLLSDLVIGASKEDLTAQNYIFYGGAESDIAFIRCQSWTDKKSVCHDAELRKALRQAFYTELERLGLHVTRSFFPLAIPGIREPSTDSTVTDALSRVKGKNVSYRVFAPDVPFLSACTTALSSAATSLGLRFRDEFGPKRQMIADLAPNLPSYTNDLVSIVTGILIDDPEADVRFMFKSKEGIRLPDPTGRAAMELSKVKPDLQRINEALWDDAIIWPVMHFAGGMWAKAHYDFSMLNTVLPPAAIHWIGQR